MVKEIAISVRKLVESILRSGDIDTRLLSNRRALEGIRLHQKIQKDYPASFQKEVFLRGKIQVEDFLFSLEGRADGIETRGEEYLIDEIKSTLHTEESLEKNPNPLHWAQVKFYGWILCKEKALSSIHLRLSYIRLESEERFSQEEEFSFKDLEDFVQESMGKFLLFQRLIEDFQPIKVASIQNLAFPFASFRKGQRELAVSTYNMIQEKTILLAQAPTGTGKTLATLFPAIKSLGQGLSSFIFYGTSRSTQKDLAASAQKKMQEMGLRLKATHLSAKEKICLNDKIACNPKDCPYAKGHYDRVLEAFLECYKTMDIFDFESIQAIAQSHQVCPFELQLDLSDYSDLLVGDYNYIFHPQSRLERLMTDGKRIKKGVLLIDEAHNLVDRGRDMYSSFLTSHLMEKALESPGLSKTLKKKIGALLEEFHRLFSLGQRTYYSVPGEFETLMDSFRKSMDIYLNVTDKEPEDALMDLYFRILNWQDLFIYFNSREFVIYLDPTDHKISLLCLDPSSVLKQIQKKFASKIYFSATLQPFDYHGHLLGLGDDYHHIDLPSPFDPRNFLILHPHQLSTRYKDRKKSLDSVVKYMQALAKIHRGNYLFFFPSYSYMNMVFEANKAWDQFSLLQERDMDHGSRREFIASFKQKKPLHGYAVMGGVFSEGIDLPGQALEGAVIVSLALPGISAERDLIMESFNRQNLPGFDYAYTIPGLIKVLQAAGRIIRDEKDRGVLVLLDQRFSQQKIQAILPNHWQIEPVHSIEEFEKKIQAFWR